MQDEAVFPWKIQQNEYPIKPHLSQAFTHNMNIMNVEKDNLFICIGVFVFVASSFRHVGHRVHFWPRVVDIDAMRLRVRVHDQRDHLLVLPTTFTSHPRHWL